MTIQIWITIGFGAAGILPLVAFLRLARRNRLELAELDAKVAARGTAAGTIGDFNTFWSDIRRPAKSYRRDLTWDVVLVGGGVTIGAITSIVATWTL